MLLRELCRTIEQRTLILEQGFEEVINKGMLTHEGAKYAGDTQSLTEYGRDVLRDSKSVSRTPVFPGVATAQRDWLHGRC